MNDYYVLLIFCLMLSLGFACLLMWVHRLRLALRDANKREEKQLQRLKATTDGCRVGGRSPAELVEFIGQTSSMQAWWLDTHEDTVLEGQVKTAPFWVEPHLASMALRSRQTVHQHQMTQSDWAVAYIPKWSGDSIVGLLALASPQAIGTTDLTWDEAWSELWCVVW